MPDLTTQANPSNASYYMRPLRFIRLVKSVEIPGKTVRKINNSAFGPAGMGMREILGYAPIQPDGSVQIQVPANVPFTIDLLDANGRRVAARHTSWLQLLPGETKSCNGCHSTQNMTSHGRAGLSTPVNSGAANAAQFPGTNPTLQATTGETMAQTLGRTTCAKNTVAPCSQLPSSDVLYTNIWTTGVTLPAGDVDSNISYTYGGTTGLSTPAPTNANCANWTGQCRITIHYASAASAVQPHIQAIWNFASRLSMVNGVSTNTTCITCHSSINAANNTIQVPPGQLDLTGAVSSVDTTVVNSYEDVVFPHDEQTLNMGVLQDLLVPDPGPPPTLVPVQLAAPMSAGSAVNSTAFLSMFDGTYHDPVLDHTGYLTPAELRLISEWLDIGGQFYNDPFVAPVAN